LFKVAIAGTGLAFDLHARALQALSNAELSVCISRSPEKAAAAAAPYKARTALSLQEALPYCDAVALCTPPGTHRALAIEAMEAGKAVLVEKPLAASMDDAKAMVEAAARTGQTLAVGFNNCFRDGFILLRNMIANGALGKLHTFHIHRQSPGLLKEDGAGSWRNGQDGVCGHVIESLSHDISILRFCAGEVKRVAAFTRATLPFAPQYDNTAVVSMELVSGAAASLFSDWNSPLAFNLRGASGSKGAVTLYGEGNWENHAARIRLSGMDADEVRPLNDKLDIGCYIREYEAFIADAAQGKGAGGGGSTHTQQSFSGIDGHNVLAVSLAILESAKTGKAVPVDTIGQEL
jgi:predicted dehydrogenase